MTLPFPPRERGGLLALDIASKAGWSYGVKGGIPVSGEWWLPHVNDHTAQCAALYDAVCGAIDAYGPSYCYTEAPLQVRTDGPQNAQVSFGLTAIVRLACHQSYCHYRQVAPATARKRVLGDGKIDRKIVKDVIMQFCRDRGWDTCGHNAGDAQVTREYGMLSVWSVGAACPGGAFDGRRFWRGDML